MERPRLSQRFTWPTFERAVLDVFREALRRLATRETLPALEDPTNFELHDVAVEVHCEFLRTKREETFPFLIYFNGNNQPEPGDSIDSSRLSKRPDLTCSLKDELATDHRLSQVHYSLECKRLGTAEKSWVLNENYTKHGIARFRETAHSYGKGKASATMIGYVQSMDPDDIIGEVNTYAATRTVPSLAKAAAGWVAKGVNELSQGPLTRDFDPAAAIQLNHLWADFRHMTFTRPPAKPKKLKKAKKKSPKKTTKKPPQTTPRKGA